MLYSVWLCVRRAKSDISTFFHRNLPDFLPFSAAFCWLTIRTPCFHFNAGTSSFHSRSQRVRAAKKFNFILRTLSLNYPFNCFVFISALSCTSSLVPFTIHSHHCRCWMMRWWTRCERKARRSKYSGHNLNILISFSQFLSCPSEEKIFTESYQI